MTKFISHNQNLLERLQYIKMSTPSHYRILFTAGQCSVAWNAPQSWNAWNPVTRKGGT